MFSGYIAAIGSSIMAVVFIIILVLLRIKSKNKFFRIPVFVSLLVCCCIIIVGVLLPFLAKSNVEKFQNLYETVEIMQENGYDIDSKTLIKIKEANAWLKEAKDDKLKNGSNSIYYMEDLDNLHFIELKSKDNSLLLFITLLIYFNLHLL